MSVFTPIRASNALITEESIPKTAVFVGGTDGIGKATLRDLVSKGFPIKVYIVGRNEAGHRDLLDELRILNPEAQLVYVQGQISLIAESQRISRLISAQEDKINLLFLSAGYLPFNGQTSEGLEASQVVSYYSHIVFIINLLPHLRAAAKSSASARAINILAAGQESTNLFLDDLTLKHPGRFSIPTYAAHAATMVTLTLKRISEAPENKGVVFIHSHPGRVSTDLFMKSRAGKFDPSKAAPAPPPGTFVELTPEESGSYADAAHTTQCDLNPVGCGQCRRAKLACHGYRNLEELAIRDETRSTTQKVLARHAPARLTTTPQLSWDMVSRNAFLCLYIDQYSYGFDALASLLATAPASGHLQASVDAVGLAFMALHVNRPDLTPLTNRKYLVAIRAVRNAIGISQELASNGAPRTANDEILQSVLLLDLYEKLTIHQGQGLPGSWLSHLQGALGVVQARPSTDFRNSTTCQLAGRTVIALTISCGAAGVPIPEALQEVRQDLDRYIRNSKWTFISLLMTIVNLRARMRSNLLASDEILKQAYELQDQLALAESKVPRSWRPHRVNSHQKLIFDHYYDVYPSHYATQVFNAFRILRLEMCSIIRNLHPNSSIAETIDQLTRDICAAVPQFILPEARPENTMPFSPLQMLECRGILTALYAAGQITTGCIKLSLEGFGIGSIRTFCYEYAFGPHKGERYEFTEELIEVDAANYSMSFRVRRPDYPDMMAVGTTALEYVGPNKTRFIWRAKGNRLPEEQMKVLAEEDLEPRFSGLIEAIAKQVE
ncbi:hypothetical protein CEP52_009006 [Fusarium oligoseptatum]|uniref:Uncharacterized protein n=1 Tax=Fusarium oligoseptatum TaxID=2604345 RepID=A0A428TF79_9HYPO|nr:hypothetical protein CEP52_009006 [Fusarium oligoseptatum]